MRKKIKQGQKIPVGFKPRERQLVLDQTLAGPDLTKALRQAQRVDGRHVVRYSLGDLDELLRYVPAEANHSTDKKIRKELEALYVGSTVRWSRTMMACGNAPRPLTAGVGGIEDE